jgi:hypothetical protein
MLSNVVSPGLIAKNVYRWVVLGVWLAFSVYVWMLHTFADLFESNSDQTLCTASYIQCTNGDDFATLTGSSVGCGCGQGIFGQSVCPVGKYGYTIAGYAATSPATSWFSILVILLLAMTIQTYYTNISSDSSETIEIFLSRVSKVAFSVFLITFAFASPGNFCTFSGLFETSWVMMGITGSIYALLTAIVHVRHWMQKQTTHEVLLSVLHAVAGFAYAGMLLFGFLYDSGSHGLELLPWVMECAALTSLMAVGPAKVWHMHYEDLQAANILQQSRL